jgi:hypothetical protein
MRILVTGMNPADSNELRRRPRVAIFQAFVEAMRYLRDQGEDLDWRRVRVGDRISSGTDAVIVSSMLPRSMNCRYALGVMWTIGEALRLEIPLVIYLTDWKFFAAHTEFRSIAREGVPYFSKKIGGVLQYDEDPVMIERYAEHLLWVCRAYGKRQSKLWKRAQILVPRYTNWGNVRIVQRMLPGAHPVHTLDPTPLFLQYLGELKANPPDFAKREKSWIHPSLSKDNTWIERQNLTWPVDRFGLKKSIVLQNERAVQYAYQQRIGALCPPYPTVGSGWWRSRWIHSAQAKSVLLCSPRDSRCVGSSYNFSGKQYELMSIERLQEVAEEQARFLDIVLQTDMGVFNDQVYAPFREAGA